MKTLLIGNDSRTWEEVETREHVTSGMAARAALPFGDNRTRTTPTSRQVNYRGRWRRVYSDAIGNSGVCYVIVKGEKIHVR